MVLYKKQIWVIFLFEFKMGHKAKRQLSISTMHLAQEPLTDLQGSDGSRSFSKEMRA